MASGDRRAALNLLEDAVEARERAEQLYLELLASEKRFARLAGQAAEPGAQKRKPE
jgi:hypothetical protein